jgi:hypothetical protein
MMIDYCPYCNERLTPANPQAPSGSWEVRAHEACLVAAGVQPLPREVARVLDAGLAYYKLMSRNVTAPLISTPSRECVSAICRSTATPANKSPTP